MEVSTDQKKGFLSSILGVGLATSCCWGPWVLIGIGSSTGLLAANSSLMKYTPYLMIFGVFFIGRGIWKIVKARRLKNEGHLPPCCRGKNLDTIKKGG
jgi:hypothetical protein